MQPQPRTNPFVVSLIGSQGSGKTSVGQRLAEKLTAQFIETSDIVKAICGDIPRNELWKTNERTKEDPSWLGKGIADCINSDRVVLSGVREQENHDYLESIGCTLKVIELWCPQQVRLKRLRDLGKVTSYGEFARLGSAELRIGLKALLDKEYPTFVTTYSTLDELVDQIAEALKST